jgi:hypothetical protein
MPPAHDILAQLAAIAAAYPWLAIAWHAYFGAFAVALLCGWRPPRRLAGILFVPALLSASAMAWIAANPFNGSVLLALAGLSLFLALKQPCAPARIAPPWFLFPGIALFAVGWAYPHFVAESSFLPYLYRSPLGLLPCPTLAMVLGMALILDGLGSRGLCLALGAFALFYGAFGALRLGVAADWTLLLGAVIVLARAMARPAAAAKEAA